MSESLHIARTILAGFDKHYRLFRETSAAARGRFERGEWAAAHAASRARIDMYDQRVREGVAAVMERYPAASVDESAWPDIKRQYVGLLSEHLRPELAETFFNSVACRVLDRRYYRHEYLFWRPALSTEHLEGDEPTYRCYYPASRELASTFRQVLTDTALSIPFEDAERDASRIEAAVLAHLGPAWVPRPNFQLHVLHSLFYRGRVALVVGRAINGPDVLPFVIPLMRSDAGQVYADGLLLDARSIGTTFSLARTYFMVDMEVPAAYVDFLRSLLPTKPTAELYTLLGLQKQGKTLFYRDLQHHLRHSTDTFVPAPGVRGMVMLVFTLPSFPYVFKIIRDHFAPPKDTDAAAVRDRYLLVKMHDRVGRMADTLEYSHVAFPRGRFDPAVLEELRTHAASSLEEEDDRIIIRHLYIERRMVPLDIYLRQADPAQARAAIIDFGNALRELASANIFPGDLLLKNWGVTRFGRVVFYDYDEIAYLQDIHPRRLPRPRSDEDEMAAEPWFNVEPNDIFPEQFATFLFPEGPHRAIFLEHHADLLSPAFWMEQQERWRAGNVPELLPYPAATRFPRAPDAASPGPGVIVRP